MNKIKPDAQIAQDSPADGNTESPETARWQALEGFGLDRPSGSLARDLSEDKKILLQRGMRIRSAVVEKDMGEGVIQFIACTDGIKRDGNRVRNDGWSFTNFEKNPQFLWCHDYSSLPIGKHVQWEIDKDNGESVLRLWSKFCSAELYPFADKVRQMYEGGYLRAGSVGWIPLEWEPLKDEEDRTVGFDFTRNELLEFSAVPVPSDPDAIAEAVQRGVVTSDDIGMFQRAGLVEPHKDGLFYTLSNRDGEAPMTAAPPVVEAEEIGAEDLVDELLADTEVREVEAVPEAHEAETCEDSLDVTEPADASLASCTEDFNGDEVREESSPEELAAAEVELSPEVASGLEEVEDRGGMNSEEEEEGVADEGYITAEKLVSTIQQASNKFADSVIAAVMEALDGHKAGVPEEEAELRVSEKTDSIELLEVSEDIVDPELMEEVLTQGLSEDIAMERVGAKVSKRTKSSLCRCRDMLVEVTDSINKLVDEETAEMEDDSDDDMEKDLKIPGAASVDEVEVEQATGEIVEEDLARQETSDPVNDELLNKIRSLQVDLGMIESLPEEPEVVDPEVFATVASRIADLQRSLEVGASNIAPAPVEEPEPKSDYVKSILARIKEME